MSVYICLYWKKEENRKGRSINYQTEASINSYLITGNIADCSELVMEDYHLRTSLELN